MTDSDNKVILKVEGAMARYGKIVVCRNVSFTVSKYEILTLLGPNGAGKTSLLGLISGLVSGAGTVTVNNDEVSGLPTYKRISKGLGVVPEGRGLFSSMSVKQNLELGARLAPPEFRKAQIEKMTDLFPVLGNRMHQPAGSMSGGEQQMLAVAKVAVGMPSVLLLDEPTQGLAPHVFTVLRHALFELRKSGLAIVLVEQRHAFAESVSDRTLVMVGGSLVYEGKEQERLSRENLMKIYTQAEGSA